MTAGAVLRPPHPLRRRRRRVPGRVRALLERPAGFLSDRLPVEAESGRHELRAISAARGSADLGEKAVRLAQLAVVGRRRSPVRRASLASSILISGSMPTARSARPGPGPRRRGAPAESLADDPSACRSTRPASVRPSARRAWSAAPASGDGGLRRGTGEVQLAAGQSAGAGVRGTAAARRDRRGERVGSSWPGRPERPWGLVEIEGEDQPATTTAVTATGAAVVGATGASAPATTRAPQRDRRHGEPKPSNEGTPEDDVILGLGGQDRLVGLEGDDLLCGGDGNDQPHRRSERRRWASR